MEEKTAGESLDALMAAFNTRIAELQELLTARNMYPATSVPELSAINVSLTAMELQVQRIKDRVREETEAIPKAKFSAPEASGFGAVKLEREVTAVVKEKNGGAPPPMWYITTDELDPLSLYMKGRLTIDKVNAAVNDMAAYAEANANLINAPKQKVAENLWEKALELRDIAMKEAVRGKHFFLEADMKGPTLKHNHSGKTILAVLRHLRRISETRIGRHRVIILLKP